MDNINWGVLFSSILVAVLTSTLTVSLAIKRYRSEKWWDKKAKCYIETIEAINDIISACDSFLIQLYTEDVLIEESQFQEIINRYRVGKSLIETQTNIGQLLLSKEAYKELLSFDGMLSSDKNSDNLTSRFADIRVAADECLSKIIPLAKKDLGVNRF